jgi:hypothetical protein
MSNREKCPILGRQMLLMIGFGEVMYVHAHFWNLEISVLAVQYKGIAVLKCCLLVSKSSKHIFDKKSCRILPL